MVVEETRWAIMLVLFLMYFSLVSVRRSNGSLDLEIESRLKSLNKQALKSIQSPDGDIIDCIKIGKQPAFNHPLLRNHVIQMRPSSYPTLLSSRNNTIPSNLEPFTQLWHQNGKCPKGTIPIRRIKKEDLMRASYLNSYGRQKNSTLRPSIYTDNAQNGEFVEIVVGGERYRGASTDMNVWAPRVQDNTEFSSAQMEINAGDNTDHNKILTGWQVNPSLYGDRSSRIFAYWTRDATRSTGCYDLTCPGFIQTNKDIALGAAIEPISHYGGSKNGMYFAVWKESRTGDWWLQVGSTAIGYWPSSIFTILKDKAWEVHFRGVILNSTPGGQHTTIEMGSGHFAEEGYGKAAFFRDTKCLYDQAGIFKPVKDYKIAAPYSNCYNLKMHTGGTPTWGTAFYYGDPGRNANCQ